MTYTLLSERIANANETCARCENNINGKCKLPVLTGIHKDRGTISTSKLISFSEDGRTCQLFREVKGMSREEWLHTVTPFDVLCPRCGWGFKEVWLETPNWCGEMSKVNLCKRCAEEVHKKLPGSEVKE